MSRVARRTGVLAVALGVLGSVLAVPVGPAHADVINGGGDYVPLVAPVRALDTRLGIGGVSGAIPAGEVRTFPVTGVGEVPSGGVRAVQIDVTTVGPAAETAVVLWPGGAAQPAGVSMVVGPSAQAVSNSAVVAVGADGRLAVSARDARTDVIVDVHGYYPAETAGRPGNGGLIATPHQRLVDTRSGLGTPTGQIPAGRSITVDLHRADVPATAIQANLTVIAGSTGGNLSAWPTGGGGSTVSTVDYLPGVTASGAVIRMDSTGKVEFVNNGRGPVDLVVDVEGYFASTSTNGSGLHPAAGRLLDPAADRALLAPNATVDIAVHGQAGIPGNGITAVALNLTAYGATKAGFLRVWPSSRTEPTTSLANFPVAQTGATARSDQAVTFLTDDDLVRVRNVSAGTIRLAVDVQGWYAGLGAKVPVRPATAAAVLDGPDRVYFAYVNDQGGLWQTDQPEPASLVDAFWGAVAGGGPRALTGPPVFVQPIPAQGGTGPRQLFVQSTDGSVWLQSGGLGSGLQNLGGPLVGPPQVTLVRADAAGAQPVILGLDADGRLWLRQEHSNGSFDAWRPAGDTAGLAQIAVTRSPDGETALVVAVDRLGAVSVATLTGDGLRSWRSLGTGYTDAKIAACADTAIVTARATDGRAAATTPDGGPLAPIGSLNVAAAPSPASSGGQAVLVAERTGGGLSRTLATGSCAAPAFGDWQSLTTTGKSPLAWEYLVDSTGARGVAVVYRSSNGVPGLSYVTGPQAPTG